jgi:hypothetical protein
MRIYKEVYWEMNEKFKNIYIIYLCYKEITEDKQKWVIPLKYKYPTNKLIKLIISNSLYSFSQY